MDDSLHSAKVRGVRTLKEAGGVYPGNLKVQPGLARNTPDCGENTCARLHDEYRL